MPTKIEWADEVWNPVTGCTKVSAGCKFCYAEGIANRFWPSTQEVQDGVTTEIEYFDGGQEIPIGTPLYRPRKFTDIRCHKERLNTPLNRTWKRPRRVFVNSMSDLFHPAVPDSFIDKVFAVMARANHTFMVLTKRPERMYGYMCKVQIEKQDNPTFSNNRWQLYDHWQLASIPLDNVWLGVSVEDQATADERIPWLLKTPAAIRFVSYEPALGHIYKLPEDLDWIIAGCESGPHARPANPNWFRYIRDLCHQNSIPFFLKQMKVDGKLVRMPELDGWVWDQIPTA